MIDIMYSYTMGVGMVPVPETEEQTMTNESDIKHESGNYWVCDTGSSYAVMKIGITYSVSDSAYDHTSTGLSVAIARCDYLARRDTK